MRRARRLEAGLTQAAVRCAGVERRHWRRGGSRRWWAPMSSGVGSGSYSTGEDGNGETRANSRGLRAGGGGGWPSSLRMVGGGGSGGVRRGPELLGHRRWTGGAEEGAVEERTWHTGVDEGDGVKKGDGRRPAPFMAAGGVAERKG
jgi:hypothetical protein